MTVDTSGIAGFEKPAMYQSDGKPWGSGQRADSEKMRACFLEVDDGAEN